MASCDRERVRGSSGFNSQYPNNMDGNGDTFSFYWELRHPVLSVLHNFQRVIKKRTHQLNVN